MTNEYNLLVRSSDSMYFTSPDPRISQDSSSVANHFSPLPSSFHSHSHQSSRKENGHLLGCESSGRAIGHTEESLAAFRKIVDRTTGI